MPELAGAELTILAVAGVAVLAGAVIQGAVGFGMNLLAAPVVTLLAPELMPGALLLVATPMAGLMVAREWRSADWGGLRWSLSGRVVGTAGGVWLVAVAGPRLLGVLVALMVMVAVGLSVRTVRLEEKPATLGGAGVVAGVFGTSVAIAGPPMALVYQHSAGPRIRATLAVFFFAGTIISLGSLGAAGELESAELVAGVAFMPFMLAGLLMAGPLRRYLDTGRSRAGVLTVAAAAAVLLLVRSLL